MLYAHENAHLILTDKDEEIAKYAETKIGEKKNKFTESEKEEYLSNLRKNVEIDKTLEEQFALARSIPESERENHSTPEEREFRKKQQNIIYFTDERVSQIKDGTIDMTVGSGTVIGGAAIIGFSIGVDTVSFGTTLVPSTGAKVIGTTGIIVGSNKFISGISQIFNGVYGREVKKGLNPISLNPIKDTLVYVNPSGEYRDFYNALEVVTEVGVGQLSPYAIGVNRNNKNQEKAIILVPETNQKQNSVYPNFDFDHIVGGDISKNGKKVTGGHSLVKGDVSIKEIIGKADSKGVYKANIRIYNSQKGEWQDKKATTTMFPSSWNENKIKEEIKGAWNSNDFESKITSRGMEWRGTSPSGIKIEGFINSDRTIAYPQYRGDK